MKHERNFQMCLPLGNWRVMATPTSLVSAAYQPAVAEQTGRTAITNAARGHRHAHPIARSANVVRVNQTRSPRRE